MIGHSSQQKVSMVTSNSKAREQIEASDVPLPRLVDLHPQGSPGIPVSRLVDLRSGINKTFHITTVLHAIMRVKMSTNPYQKSFPHRVTTFTSITQ